MHLLLFRFSLNPGFNVFLSYSHGWPKNHTGDLPYHHTCLFGAVKKALEDGLTCLLVAALTAHWLTFWALGIKWHIIF